MHINPEKLKRLESNLQLEFKDKDLLVEAITHSTYAYENKSEKIPDNERLEFLGDAVLDLAISDFLFNDKTGYEEGFMTKTRALLVCENCLADLAGSLDLGNFLLLGKGEEATGGRNKPSNLANAMEAVFGAVYLDCGFNAARELIISLMQEDIAEAVAGKIFRDYKSRLLEIIQAEGQEMKAEFTILNEAGPVHDRVFTAGVKLNCKLLATGTGGSKKEAEQQAARKAIENLDSENNQRG